MEPGKALKTKQQLWLARLDNTLRRMCTPKARSGKIEVSSEVRAQWLKGGAPRKNLLDILVKYNGDKDWVGILPNAWSAYLCMAFLPFGALQIQRPIK